MKKLIIALTLIVLLASVPFAFARGNHRSAVDQQWQRVEAYQKRQNERFKKLEREAERELRPLKGETESFYPTRIIYPPCGR
jgi:hypothetical protein